MYRKILNQYKEISIQIIESVRSDREEIELFDKRQEIINKILNINNSNEEIKKMYEEMELGLLDKEIEIIINEKMNNIKIKMANFAKSKLAYQSYIKVNRNKSFFYKDV